jgi:hypothetical protein
MKPWFGGFLSREKIFFLMKTVRTACPTNLIFIYIENDTYLEKKKLVGRSRLL